MEDVGSIGLELAAAAQTSLQPTSGGSTSLTTICSRCGCDARIASESEGVASLCCAADPESVRGNDSENHACTRRRRNKRESVCVCVCV